MHDIALIFTAVGVIVNSAAIIKLTIEVKRRQLNNEERFMKLAEEMRKTKSIEVLLTNIGKASENTRKMLLKLKQELEEKQILSNEKKTDDNKMSDS